MRLFQNCTASNRYQNFEEEKILIQHPKVAKHAFSYVAENLRQMKDVKILRLSFVMAKLKSEAR